MPATRLAAVLSVAVVCVAGLLLAACAKARTTRGATLAELEQLDVERYGADNLLRPDRRAKLPRNPGGTRGWVWTVDRQLGLFKPGFTYRGHYPPNVTPTPVDWYLVDPGGRIVERVSELRAALRPIETAKQAERYRNLLWEVTLADADGPDVDMPPRYLDRLRHDAERPSPYGGFFVNADVERWKLGSLDPVGASDGGFVITRPVYHPASEHAAIPMPAPGMSGGTPVRSSPLPAAVLLIRETIDRDGGYLWERLRTLEQGSAAEPYRIWPLL